MSDFRTTPDLRGEFNPQPKTYRAKKKLKGLSHGGKRTDAWEEGRKELKVIFAQHNITTCEIPLPMCIPDNFLGFAHVLPRVNYNADELVDPHNVVLASNPCHDYVDKEMGEAEAAEYLGNIVKARGW